MASEIKKLAHDCIRRVQVILLVAALLFTAAVPAHACSVHCGKNGEYCDNSPFAQRKWARQVVKNADAIIDGEVVQPFIFGKQNAIVRAHRIFKGPDQEFFEVGAPTSCDRRLDAMGERLRLVLFLPPLPEEVSEQHRDLVAQIFAGQESVYYTSIDESGSEYIDDLLDSDRDEDWPYFPGEPAPAEPPLEVAP